MNLLVVAHPDDEAIWFPPESFDLIIIAFCDRLDLRSMGVRRRKALREHPLRNRIQLLSLKESGSWRNKKPFSQKDQENFFRLCKILSKFLKQHPVERIFTHNAHGEYGHFDHILVHHAVRTIAEGKGIEVWTTLDSSRPIKNLPKRKLKIDANIHASIKRVYGKNNCWTWDRSFKQRAYLQYQRLMIGGNSV